MSAANPNPAANVLTLNAGGTINAQGRAVTVSLPTGAPNTNVTIDGVPHTLAGHYALILGSAGTITNNGPSQVTVCLYN